MIKKKALSRILNSLVKEEDWKEAKRIYEEKYALWKDPQQILKRNKDVHSLKYKVGDKVIFLATGEKHYGIIKKINPVNLKIQEINGTGWTVHHYWVKPATKEDILNMSVKRLEE